MNVNNIFKRLYNQTSSNLKLADKLNDYSFYEIIKYTKIRCLESCSFDQNCFIIQFNKTGSKCRFYRKMPINLLETVQDQNSEIYQKINGNY